MVSLVPLNLLLPHLLPTYQTFIIICDSCVSRRGARKQLGEGQWPAVDEADRKERLPEDGLGVFC